MKVELAIECAGRTDVIDTFTFLKLSDAGGNAWASKCSVQ